MEFTNKLINKYTVAILWLLVVATIPAHAEQSPYWVEMAPRSTNLSELESAIGTFTPDVQATLKVCMIDGRYAVVNNQHTPDEKAAEALRAKIKGFQVAQAPAAHCFHPSSFLTLPRAPRTNVAAQVEQKPAQPAKPAVRVSLRSQVEQMKQHYTKRSYKAEQMQNTFVSVLPEVTTKVFLSAKDINRISCGPGRPVKDVVVPDEEEKNIRLERHENDVYVDFITLEDSNTGERLYAQNPAELYVMCGSEGTVYTIISVPNPELPAQTVQLVDNSDKLKKNESLFKGMPFEEKVVELIKQAYAGTIEETPNYTVKRINRPVHVLEKIGIEVVLHFEAKIEGEGLRIKQYGLKLNPNFKADMIRVKEKFFLLPQLVENPVAISLDNELQIRKDGFTRLFIIEQTNISNS